MFCYGIIILLVGLGLITGAASIPVWLHRRYGQPYALLTVGVITFVLALLVQIFLLQTLNHVLLRLLFFESLMVGVVVGFTEEFARLFGFQLLARGTVSKAQALMIGAGHGFSRTLYVGFIAVGLGLSLLGYDSQRPDDLAALLSGALAESLNGLLPILMHMALSWLVLQVFLRGELGWLFVAIFMHSSAEIMAVLLGPEDAWIVVLWRSLIAIISLAIIFRVNPPETSAT